ncbi:hypothetical protein F5Y01DRAFT_315543 [Xylaria sp. FL0043]|nr:hypothetical protein F5Y01DRAFT_315543 [Xylaria sp. FL0043]
MCFQVVEVYAVCRCLYYQHAVDRCAAYGRPGHEVSRKTIPVGYACSVHSQSSSYGAYAASMKCLVFGNGLPFVPNFSIDYFQIRTLGLVPLFVSTPANYFLVVAPAISVISFASGL